MCQALGRHGTDDLTTLGGQSIIPISELRLCYPERLSHLPKGTQLGSGRAAVEPRLPGSKGSAHSILLAVSEIVTTEW